MAEPAALPSSSVACAHCGLPTRPARGDDVRAFCCLGCRLASAATGGRVGAKAAFLEARLLLSAFLSMGVMEFTLVLYGEDLATSPDPATVALRRLGQIALAMFTVPVLGLLGVPLLKGAWQDVRAGRIRMDGLIVLGTFSAFGLSLHHTILGEGPVYYETATTVLTLVMLGRRLEATVRAEGRHAAEHLADALPGTAHRVTHDGTIEEVAPDVLKPGDRIVVRPGEAFPADVTIRSGAGSVACDRITGEEAPRETVPGDRVLAGSANGASAFEAEVVRPWAEGWLGAVRALLDAPLPPTRIMRRVDRIAGHLAWISLLLAGWAAHLGAAEGGVRLDRQGDADVCVRADRFRLEQVIVNLVKNAAEALEGAPAPRLTLSVTRDGERVRLTVADNGPGLPPEVRAQLFTPFVTTRANGLGLGLVICRDIIAGFGGELDLIASETGAVFVATLEAA